MSLENSPAVAGKTAGEHVREHGEIAARTIIALWKGPALDDACNAALRLGHLNAVSLLPYYRCTELLDKNLELHKVNKDHWPDVSSHFHQARDTVISRSEVWSRYFPDLVASNDNEPDEETPTSCDLLAALTNPGCLIGELVDWIVSSSSRPSRELALSAVIPFVGALLGRRFASQTDLRTNFYVVALADSGYGKDHARSQLKRLITAAGLDRISGPNRFMSATALRNSVMNKPACLCMVDEFGGMMRQINDPRAGIHSVLIRSDLLEMFTSASTFFEGAAYAKEAPAKIHNPNLCVYGTSTPDDFWASVSSLRLTDFFPASCCST